MPKRLVVAAVTAACLVVSAAVAQAGSWSTPEKIWHGRYWDPSMLVDAHGHVHVAAAGSNGIWYLTNETGVWTQTHLTTSYFHDFPAIALDPTDGSLTVAYNVIDDPTSDSGCGVEAIRYVTNRSGTWSTSTRVPDTRCRALASLEVRDGKLSMAASSIHIHSIFPPPDKIHFFTNVSGPWTDVELKGHGRPDLALDGAGKPRIVYVRGYRDVLWYAKGATKTGGFSLERVGPELALSPSLALDGMDRPRICWILDDGGSTAGWYSHQNATGWHSRKVLNAAGFGIDLAVGANGRPYIAAANGQGGLWYATNASGSWTQDHVLPGGAGGLGGIGIHGTHVDIVYQHGSSFYKGNPSIWFIDSTP